MTPSGQSRPDRVVHLVSTLCAGGVQRSILELASHTDPERFAPEVWFFLGAGEMAPAFKARGIPVRKVRQAAHWDLSIVPRLIYSLRHHRAAVLHTHDPASSAFGRLSAANAGIRAVISTEHSVTHWSNPERFINRLVRATADRADFVVSVSKSVEYLTAGAGASPRGRSRVIHDGVSLPPIVRRGAGIGAGAAGIQGAAAGIGAGAAEIQGAAAGVSVHGAGAQAGGAGVQAGGGVSAAAAARARFHLGVEGPIVGSLGSLSPHKGFSQMIETMPLVLSERADAWFVIGGTGPERSALERQARGLGVADRLILPGPVLDPGEILPALNVFVLPSLTEGYGIGALEAMAHGIPVVATRVGGVPELVGEGEGGLLVNPNAPREMAAVVLYLLNSDLYSAEIGVAGRAKAAGSGSAARMAGEYMDLYREALQIRS